MGDKNKEINYSEITLWELEQSIKRLKTRSASGKDGIYIFFDIQAAFYAVCKGKRYAMTKHQLH